MEMGQHKEITVRCKVSKVVSWRNYRGYWTTDYKLKDLEDVVTSSKIVGNISVRDIGLFRGMRLKENDILVFNCRLIKLKYGYKIVNIREYKGEKV